MDLDFVSRGLSQSSSFLVYKSHIGSGGTDNHLMLVSLVNKGLTGKRADAALVASHITVNKNAVPNDPQPPMVTSGIRVGTPAVTTRGFGEDEVRDVARWMCDVMDHPDDESVKATVIEQVSALCARFPVYAGVD